MLQMRLNPTSFKGTDYIITEFPRPSLRRVPNAPIAQFDDTFMAKSQEMLGIMYEAKGKQQTTCITSYTYIYFFHKKMY